MPSSNDKFRKSGANPLSSEGARPGLPDPSSVLAETVLVSPKGQRYRILRTDEKDAYDPPAQPEKERS